MKFGPSFVTSCVFVGGHSDIFWGRNGLNIPNRILQPTQSLTYQVFMCLSLAPFQQQAPSFRAFVSYYELISKPWYWPNSPRMPNACTRWYKAVDIKLRWYPGSYLSSGEPQLCHLGACTTQLNYAIQIEYFRDRCNRYDHSIS
jgi:hypothetical protein